jgi:hypothetical protein
VKKKKKMGKSPAIGMSATTAALTATRLPPLKKLRVRRPNKKEDNPCEAIMLSVLSMFFYKTSPTTSFF